MSIENTPILVGAGQCVVRDIQTPEEVLTPVELAARAAELALADTGCEGLAEHIDTLVMIRLMLDSARSYKHPFGTSNKPPLSVAQRIGANPRRLVYGHLGGQSPQRTVNELAEAIFNGESKAALICGSEATAAMKQALRNQWQLDWSETLEGDIEDKGIQRLQTDVELTHGATFPLQVYALFENAWRVKHGLSVAEHQALMAKLFAPFSEVAAQNPYSQYPVARDEEFLANASKENFPINIPYHKWLVAQDAVNQGASVVMTSVGMAKKLGIPESQWVYLHGYADADDTWVSERPDLGRSNALAAALNQALKQAGKSIADMDLVDIYSCFPIAVLAACDAMGLDWETNKVLTVTGGLPFFGGPGNSYSLHAIAEVATRLREMPGQFGLISANGGFLSKQSVGVYSTEPVKEWKPADTGAAQQLVDAQETVEVLPSYQGEGEIETYSFVYAKGQPVNAFIVGRVEGGKKRFLAKVKEGDSETLQAIESQEPIGRKVVVNAAESGNEFTLV